SPLILLRLSKLLRVVVHLGSAGDGCGVVGIHLQDVVKSIDRLLSELNVLRTLSARNVLLGIRSSQVQPGIQQGGIQGYRVLEMHDGGLELRVAERPDTLVELVSRP